MKKILPLVAVSMMLLFAQSCTKAVVQPYGLDITGSWVLVESSENYGNGWRYYNTGLEGGVFSFYSQGAARYTDGYNRMEGYWDIRTVSTGYYDQYGNYYSDLHQMFEMHVRDGVTRNSIDFYFDDIRVSGNRIIATSYSGNVITKYIFVRY